MLKERERERERVNSFSDKRSLNKSFSKYISILCSLSSLSVLGSVAINHSCVLNKNNNVKNANDNQTANKEQINNNINNTNTTGTASAELFFSSYKSIKGILNYSYNEDNNTLSISCSSTENLFSVEDGVFKNSIDISGAGITNAKIVAFPDHAFDYKFETTCEISGSLILPNTLETIGISSFSRHSGLTSISLPSSLTSIGTNAFIRCPIKQVNFEGNDTYKWANNVGQGHLLFTSDKWDYKTAPIGCLAYGDIDMSKATDLSEIKASLFNGCAGITSINLSNSITAIKSNAFYNCSGLASISLPSSLTAIAASSFQNDSKISEVFLNFNDTQIKSLDSFFNNQWLSNAVGSDKMSNVNVYFPRNEADAYLNVDNQKTLGIYGCKIGNNTNATSWISGNVTSGNLFYTIENSNISPISIDNLIAADPVINSKIVVESKEYSINEIKSTYFQSNTNLSGTLTIDKGITKIEANAFNGCDNINSIKLLWNLDEPLPTLNYNWLGSLDIQTKDIVVNAKNIVKYKMNKSNLKINNCNICSLIEASSLIEQAKGNIKFTDDGNEGSPILNIQSIVLFESITDPIIDSISFNNETDYKLNTIQENLFNNNDKLQGKLTIESSITAIEANAFSNCQNITSLNLASSITSLGKNIFDQTSINKIYLNWNEDQLKEIFASSSNEGSIDPYWLGSLRNKQDLKIYVPKGTKTTYEKYKDQLGISSNQIVDPSDNNSNLPLILGLSLGLGIPVLAGIITGTIIGIKKHKSKKTNKKKIKK